ncbi:MAG: hypothetical protein E6Q51_04135 [Methylophilus methylotrophus]|uniref:Uncharacterized protein n=1 Tax=Methylophilus methylotrophus TaxID=17 RepID=A0A5C7WI69_METME|nr:MAG: hypothetical protein E6Q51_04135 [Methylophilus methylotrophus]
MEGSLFEEEFLSEELTLSKTDVVRRQLNTGIRMFIFDWDPVALHTVVSAGHEVARDLAHSTGIKKSIKDSPLLSESERKKFIDAVNYPQNFFKHADRDPHSRMAFRYRLIPLFILDAVMQYIAIGEESTHEMKVFLIWVQLKYPSLLRYEPVEADLSKIRSTTKNPNSFRALAKVLLNEPGRVGNSLPTR